MTLMFDDYQELLRKLEKLKRRSAEAGGELKAVLTELKKYGYDSIKEAGDKLPVEQEAARKLAERYATEKAKLEAEYKDQLEGL